METEDKMLEIKQKVSQSSLYINRVPKKTKQEFIQLADEEFEGDWGFLLKWLMDFRSGLLSTPNQHLLEQLMALQEELNSLKSKEPEKQMKVIKSVGGQIITEREA